MPMRFSVFAFSALPDLDTARKNFDLHDLNDKEVAKVLFHQRKQQTGHSETLNWDQLQIASVSLVHHLDGRVSLETCCLPAATEKAMIETFFKAFNASGRLIFWGGEDNSSALIDFRCMKRRISDRDYWQKRLSGQLMFDDLREMLAPAGSEVPSMDAFAKRFDYPGMCGMDNDGVWDAYLLEDFEQIARHSDYRALNSYLLALEVLSVRGELSFADADDARGALRKHLENRTNDRGKQHSFIESWDEIR